MLAMGFSEAKTLFFDRPAVQKDIDAVTRKGLSRFGAYVRQRARTSIKKGSAHQVSAPGKPPLYHAGQIRLIFFAYDPENRSVVIGPIPFGGAAAAALEFGGQTVARTRDGTITVLFIRARPYMQPAFEAELPNATVGFAA